MSIDQRITELLEESKKLQKETLFQQKDVTSDAEAPRNL